MKATKTPSLLARVKYNGSQSISPTSNPKPKSTRLTANQKHTLAQWSKRDANKYSGK